jgi:hypothetical protein
MWLHRGGADGLARACTAWRYFDGFDRGRRDEMRHYAFAVGLVVVLTTCAGEGASAQLIGAGNNVPAEYIEALSVANRFLEDWVTGNIGDASQELSVRLRHELKDRSWFAQYMAGHSKRHHQAFEIIGVESGKADHYRFHVILYELAEGAASGDSNGSLFELVKQGGDWKVDSLPRSSDFPSPPIIEY